MSIHPDLSAWDLPSEATFTNFEGKPLRAEAAFDVEVGGIHYLLFAFPKDRQDSVTTAVTRAIKANKHGIASIVPVMTKSKQFGSVHGILF